MRNSFILWDTAESDSVEEAIKTKKYRILYNYVSPNAEDYIKIQGCLKIVKSYFTTDTLTITEVPWMALQ